MNLEQALAAMPLFSEFDAAELAALERAMTIGNFETGHVFIREGDAGRAMDAAYVLLEGRVKVTRAADSKGLEKELVPGELFGLVALVDRGERTASCTAEGPVVAASLARAAFDHLLHSNASLGAKFQLVVARQLARDWDRLNRMLRDALGKGGA
ncbi:MAG: cyclic nucleotide-binding domain-containing protein [Polyangiales bacterium]